MGKSGAAVVGAIVLGAVTACTPAQAGPASSLTRVSRSGATLSASTSAPPGVTAATTAPAVSLSAPDLSGAGRLTPFDASATAQAQAVIAALPTKGRGAKTGYERALFGQRWTDDAGTVLWSHNGCGTRDDILARDLDAIAKRNSCVVTAGTFTDPYTGASQVFAKATADQWPIDHVVPLAYAYVMGAAAWTEAMRTEFANDPLNLVLTTGTVNAAKADSGPAAWLPPDKPIRCAYVGRFALVATKYELPVTPADKDAMTRQCQQPSQAAAQT